MMQVLFNVPYVPDGAFFRISDSLNSGKTAGDGPATLHASQLLKSLFFVDSEVLLTPSCTHALELAVRLLDLTPGDEVIVPSFTFTSTANAIVLGGGVPVFVDIEPATQNIDIERVAAAINSKTKAVFCINYAGISPDLENLRNLCDERGIVLLEDNAHGLGGSLDGKKLGTFGAFATQSFHETKNIQCGEGGCLVLNDPRFVEPAEIMREKGTDRSRFFRGQVDKYTWVEAGSSWLLADPLAALLSSQLEVFGEIQGSRARAWNCYDRELKPWADELSIRQMTVPSNCQQPFHMYYLMLDSLDQRSKLIQHMRNLNVFPAFHYQPLHSSTAGRKFGRTFSDFTNTEIAANQLLRLPLWAGITETAVEQVVEAVITFRG